MVNMQPVFWRLSLALAFCFPMGAASRTDWPELRTQVKTTLHIPEKLPSLQDKKYGKFAPAIGVEADRIAYSTDYDLRVPAIVYHQAGATIVRHPALIVVNSDGGDKSSWYAAWAGILYARAGAIVLTYDPAGEFERNKERRSATGQHDQFIPPDQMAIRLTGLMVTDVLQARNYLASRKDVDDKRIAVVGYSLGSFISALACAVSTDIHACVLTDGGDLDGPDGFWDTKSNKMCAATAYKALSFLGDRGVMLYALNARRGPTLVWNGNTGHGQDFFAQLRAETVKAAGSTKDVFEFGFTANGGQRPYFLTRPVALWMFEKLQFPDWKKKQVETMPETHISDWMIKNHFQTAASTADERDEDGTMALGNDIPPVPRDSLHAVPEAVWTAEQESFVYETWVDRAQAAVRGNAP
jgi:dienelactone hydrolase